MLYILDTIEQLKILKDKLIEVEKSNDLKLGQEVEAIKFAIKTLANQLVKEVEDDKYYLKKKI